MTLVNKERGEMAMTLAGKEFVLRPTYGALAEIEGTLGQGIVPLAERIHRGEYGIVDLAVIVTAALRSRGEPATVEKVGEMILQTGLGPVVGKVMEFLKTALNAGQALGEAQAAETGPG